LAAGGSAGSSRGRGRSYGISAAIIRPASEDTISPILSAPEDSGLGIRDDHEGTNPCDDQQQDSFRTP
jgi:hypothetical protein